MANPFKLPDGYNLNFWTTNDTTNDPINSAVPKYKYRPIKISFNRDSFLTPLQQPSPINNIFQSSNGLGINFQMPNSLFDKSDSQQISNSVTQTIAAGGQSCDTDTVAATPPIDTVEAIKVADSPAADLPVKTTEIPVVATNVTPDSSPATQSTTSQTINDKTDKPNADTKMQKKASNGPTLEDTLTKFYGKKYTNASDEGREKLAVAYFDWLSKEKKTTISQGSQFELYRQRSSNDEDYKRLSGVIDKLEAKYQLNAANSVINKGTSKQKDIGQRVVADDYQNYDGSVQLGVAKLITDSKNVDAIKIGASHAADLEDQNQVGAVNIFEKADISDDAKKSVDKILINQYSDYAVENQLEIHKIMSSSKYSETVEYAASNIDCLDKSNQAAAVKFTISTGNEQAIKAAAANYNSYDENAKDDIKDTLSATKYTCDTDPDSSADTHNDENDASTENTQTTPSANYGSVSDTALTPNNLTSNSAVANVIKLANGQNDDTLRSAIDKLSGVDKIRLAQISSDPKILSAILSDDPSTQILFNLDESSIKAIGFKRILPQLSFLNPITQLCLVKLCAQNGDINSIQRNQLSPAIRSEYDKIAEEIKRKQ